MTDTAHLDIDTVSEHTKQWLEKAVIGLNLCPFAKAPHVKNLVRIVVSEARHLDGFLEDLDRELQLLGNTPASELETTLLVHPTLFPDFETFNQMLEIADDAVVENELEGIVQIAPFHPDFQFEGTEADNISNYTNRSPYPMCCNNSLGNLSRILRWRVPKISNCVLLSKTRITLLE